MLSILNQLSRLKQSLSHERDNDATELVIIIPLKLAEYIHEIG
jgi:hypothetical protein